MSLLGMRAIQGQSPDLVVPAPGPGSAPFRPASWPDRIDPPPATGSKMPAACQRNLWGRHAFDLHRLLVQTYTRLIMLPANEDGSKMAVLARFGTRDVCLVEPLATDPQPEGAPLRVELYDRARGHAVESITCSDLQEAEDAATVLMEDARAGALGWPPAHSDRERAETTGRETILLRSVRSTRAVRRRPGY